MHYHNFQNISSQSPQQPFYHYNPFSTCTVPPGDQTYKTRDPNEGFEPIKLPQSNLQASPYFYGPTAKSFYMPYPPPNNPHHCQEEQLPAPTSFISYETSSFNQVHYKSELNMYQNYGRTSQAEVRNQMGDHSMGNIIDELTQISQNDSPGNILIPDNEKISKPAENETKVQHQDSAKEKDEFWTKENISLLTKWANQYRFDWKKVAKKFENKKITSFIVKSKYKSLSMTQCQKRVRFTLSEDLMIAKYFKIYGTDWQQISTYFTGRNAVMLKNRYYAHIRKRGLYDTLLNVNKKLEEQNIPIDKANLLDFPELISIYQQEEKPQHSNNSEINSEDKEDKNIQNFNSNGISMKSPSESTSSCLQESTRDPQEKSCRDEIRELKLQVNGLSLLLKTVLSELSTLKSQLASK